MARNVKTRLKKLQKKTAKRRQKRREIIKQREAFRSPPLLQAKTWPFYEILVTENWQEPGTLVQIIFARHNSVGQYAIGGLLIDLDCLGVKTGFGNISDRGTYLKIRNEMAKQQTMIPADANLAAKIVREGVAYAKSLGFKPDPDYRDAMMILGEVEPEACDTPIRLGGDDGKPFFVAGPDDNVDVVIRKLTKAVGPDGFQFIVPVDPPPGNYDDTSPRRMDTLPPRIS